MNQNFLEAEAVKLKMEEYFQATYNADIEALRKIFHEKASMNGFLGPDMLVGTPEPFLADLASKPSMAERGDDYRCVIRSIQVEGNIASVVLFVDGFYGEASIEDHFHLIKDDGEWKIICKTFTTI